MIRIVRALYVRLTTILTDRHAAGADRGSHATEYAIGIGLGAAVAIGVYRAYKSGVADVMSGWVLK
ncbi:hypothetical protein [Phytohabitans kaempferiae]|uniref:DUF4244 domain-containing protein n=1 Tax=Phytohabitans kaempferiae TaxID=1620943 RepID=A0ABV6M9W6_9ACTN